ncbi:hypothetical protein [Paenibacillus sp. EZ-K15]|uniref:hypothetical protein n=1 Tax=Paenibacillus sp. EZ-K15 TaxID=2044275 RepID=UPI000BF2F2CD|nr:hypothetical protein [Paenibacillus sp. EZ-K15]
MTMQFSNLGRITLNYNKDWRFILDDESGAELGNCPTMDGECVNLPHTPRIRAERVDEERLK